MTNGGADQPLAQTTGKPHANAPLPVVGVGASAGGLEAFTELLKHLPLDTGMAFVLVQHLDPEHDSALAQLLSRATSLPVNEVANHSPIEANHVYVIPPNTDLLIARGALKLQPRKPGRSPNRSIDFFFESLAQDQRERAIGVVLSGTASDGTLGLEAIKAEGGITFAQDDSARYDSMPRSAVAAGCVDFTLSPAQIAQELARIARHPYLSAAPSEPLARAEDDRAQATAHEDDASPLPSGGSGAKQARPTGDGEGANGFKKILTLLRNHCGVDFSLYKSTTIQRRVTRRLVLSKQQTLDDYARFLRGNAKELDALYSDVLISVTSFFRNPEAFEILKRKVFPKLLGQRGDGPVRVWVLGCSTGQEAYSIAMAFAEAAEKAPRSPKLQVFATDLNEPLLEKARHGLYARSLAEDVSPERLRRFFVEEEGGYRVVKTLRETVVFARQNLIDDPPFSRIDLVSCRNLLIYLEPSLQRKAFPTFHYALKPEGFLFLGAAESIGGAGELFEAVDKKYRIYSKKAAPTPGFHLPPKRERDERRSDGPPARQPSDAADGLRGELNAQREADRVAVLRFAPPSVLVNAELQVLQFRGPTGAYLEPASGKASFDVLKMAREGLMLPLRAAINQAKKENKVVRSESARVKRNGKARTIQVEVIPLKNLRERCFLIVFEEAGKTPAGEGRDAGVRQAGKPDLQGRQAGKPDLRAAKEESGRVAELEAELAEMRDYLQSVQEQHEAANEELQAANEEVQSANEELQSLNEELETSKEELESANEELTTVNDEMSNRNLELNRLNGDLLNLQTSTKLAIVLLARDLTIRRFSAAAEKQFELLAGDVGRPIGHLRHNLTFSESEGASDGAGLEGFIAESIAEVRERECEVRDATGRWFSLRVRPYFTLDNKVDGAVLVLLDIDALKQTERAAVAARDYAQSIVETVPDPLLILNADLRVDTANEAFYGTFQVSPADTEGRLIYDLGNGQWRDPRLRRMLEDILPRNSFFDNFEVTHDFEGLGRRTMLLNARTLADAGDERGRILLGIQDVTDRKAAEIANASLAAIVESSDDAIVSKDLSGVITSWNRGAERLFGYTAQETIGQPITMLIPADRPDEEPDILARLVRGESVDHFETIRVRKDGSPLEVSLTISPLQDSTGRIIGASKIARDNTERKRAAEVLREADHHKNEFLAMLAHELRNPLAPIRNMLEVMKRTPADADLVEQARGVMDRQLAQMTRLIDDLLDVSRISRGRLDLRRQRVELAAVVEQAVEACRPAIEAGQHELALALPPAPVVLDADPARLAQVFGNLLTNACKYSERPGRISLAAERRGGEVLVSVKDDGIGISPEMLPRIFEMFAQADQSLERSQGGLGLGLTLVQRLVELHGGSVSAHSAGVGRGSEFEVRLPAVPEGQPAEGLEDLRSAEVERSETAPQPRSQLGPVSRPRPSETTQLGPVSRPRPSAASESADSEPTKARRILVVDDNRDSAQTLAMLLKITGHETQLAYDGREAVEAADSFRPDVALLDLGLPELNGYEAAAEIRRQPWGRRMLLVALTGWGQDDDRRRSREAGFDAHLVKPVDFAALREILSRPD